MPVRCPVYIFQGSCSTFKYRASQRELKRCPAQTQHHCSARTAQEHRLRVSRSAAHLEQLQAMYFHLAGPIEVATHRPFISHFTSGSN